MNNPPRLKVMHVITGLGDGGAEAVLYRLCKVSNGHQHQVVSLSDEGKYGSMLRDLGVSVQSLGLQPGQLPFRAFFALRRHLQQDKPDVVQTWMYHADFLGGLCARLAGIESVVWGIRHGTLERGSSSIMTMRLARILGLLSRWVPRKIVVCAQRAKDVHSALGYRDEKMVVIPNGYDLSHFQPDTTSRQRLREALGLDPHIPTIGCVGRYDPQKDHANLLHALSLLKDKGYVFQCLLIGTGLESTNQELLAVIRDKGLSDSIQLLGQRDDVAELMNAMDIHVLASAYGEAFPNVLNEAMACGTPCVTTDVGDAALIVGDAGWVAPPKDAQALAEALKQALTSLHSEQWDRRCSACRARVESHFSIEQMRVAYESLWNSVIYSRGQARDG